ncbi:MAG: DUF6461 domain-containing protein [Kineosporiaceae bacterium]
MIEPRPAPLVRLRLLVLACVCAGLAACSSPGPAPDASTPPVAAGPGASGPGAGGSGAGGSSASPSGPRTPPPTPTSPFALGPGGRAALGPAYCVVAVRPRPAYGLAEVLSRLGADAAAARSYDEARDGEAFRAGAEELPAATPGVDDRGPARYRVAEQSGAWTVWQAAGRRCIADATLVALTRGGGTAMAYTRDVDDQARLALARDGVVLVNLDPGILPDTSDRRGARPGALDADALGELTIAAQHEGNLDVPAAGLIERTVGVRLDDRWAAAPSTLAVTSGS